MTDAPRLDVPTPAIPAENHRAVQVSKIGHNRFKATNGRGGETYFGTGGDDPDFSPVELLLAAIAGCSAIDVDLITAKRAPAIKFEVLSEGDKVRDEQGNHMTNLRLTFDLEFPEGEAGDAARSVVQRSMEQSRDRLCSVSRTVQIGEPVEFRQA
ncbi:OsmC family protein [Nocardioides daphniae]|uniref:OsmC family peroxiredoxin n=1 Tax=Nocardioides daphniae TaxID=402297 RepID=A0A4P7UD94_9ACTN|nr:OsmC family protein [Nocardioides daphniae]QCC77325.1 OsmC family peroxiredoxin [Nocardioides daphniae]GGD25239.1 osmotically inducible protein C [Nocardioides daphniae]